MTALAAIPFSCRKSLPSGRLFASHNVSAADGLTETPPDGTLKVRTMADSAIGRYFCKEVIIVKKLKVLLCFSLAVSLAAGLIACGEKGIETEGEGGKEMEKTELEKGVSAIEVTHHDRTIHGDAYIPDAEEFPLVIFSHGYNGCKDDFRSDAAFLLNEGIASITFTFCGSGARDRSGFATTQMTLFTEQEDLEALMDYAKSIKGFNGKLYLFGGSQGGMVSAMAAQARSGDITGLVLIFPAFSIPDDWSSRYPESQFPNPEDIPEIIPWWGVDLGRDFAATARDFNIYESMAEFTKPVMIFHGTADNIVPISYSKRASETYPNCWYQTYAGAGHGFASNLMAEIDGYLLEFIRTGDFPG